MASILCRNGREVHTHDSLIGSKICWGIAKAPAPYTPPAPPVEGATSRQVAYVGTLGGDQDYAVGLTKKACSDYIESLLKKGKRVTTAAPARTKRQEMILSLLDGVPDGYFAVSRDGGDDNVSFLRVKRPTSGQYKGCVKVQSQHSEVLDNKMVYYPGSDRLWFKRGSEAETEEALMFLLADWHGSAQRYSRLIGKCCRCNLALTDGRSRHYGIGPDCEQVWPWMIGAVEERVGPYRP